MKKTFHKYAFVFGILLFYIYGFLYGILLNIVIIPLCKKITHECPNCGTILLIDKFCNLKLQEENVFKLK